MTTNQTPLTQTPPQTPAQPAPGASSTWFVPDVAAPSRPQNPPAAIVVQSANGKPKMSGQPAMKPRPFVQNAAASSQNPRSDTRPDIAAPPANSGQNSGDTGDGNGRARNGSIDPLNSGSNRGYVAPPQIGACAYCGRPLIRKSRNGRYPKFCNDNNDKCRVAAWRARQKENEATHEQK